MARGISAIIGRVEAIGLTALWLAMIVGFSTIDLSAQGAAAAIQGTVTDSTKAVIPRATITATNMETNLERTVTSNSSGLYQIPNLPPGKYRVQIRAGLKNGSVAKETKKKGSGVEQVMETGGALAI